MTVSPMIFGILGAADFTTKVGPARYWRLTITKYRFNGNDASDAGKDTRVAEFQLFVGSTRYPTVAMTGPSSPAPLVASARTESAAGTFKAWKAFDNLYSAVSNSRWISDTSGGPQWVQIDLGEGNAIWPDSCAIAPDDAVAIGGGYYPLDFKVEGSNTGAFAGEQFTIFSVTGLTSGWAANTLRSFVFPPPPAVTTIPYNEQWHQVSLFHRFEGANGQAWFHDDAGRAAYAHGGAALTTADACYGSSCLELSDGAYVEVLDGAAGMPYSGAAFALDRDPSVFECAIKLVGAQPSSRTLLLGKGDGTAGATSFLIYLEGPSATERSRIVFRWVDFQTKAFVTVQSDAIDLPFDAWHHVVVQIANGELRFYANGTRCGGVRFSGQTGFQATAGTPVRIGRGQGDDPMQLIGRIDQLILLVYTLAWTAEAVYDADFTPGEIRPWQDPKRAAYGLLIHGDGPDGSTTSVRDVCGATVTLGGNANVRTGRYPSGHWRWQHNGSAIALDGQSWISASRTPANDVAGRDFTIEAWVYLTEGLYLPDGARAGDVVVFDSRGSNSNAASGFLFVITPSNQIKLVDIASGATAKSMSSLLEVGVFHHISANYRSGDQKVLFTLDGNGDSAATWWVWPVMPTVDVSGWRFGASASGDRGIAGAISGIRIIAGDVAYASMRPTQHLDKPWPE